MNKRLLKTGIFLLLLGLGTTSIAQNANDAKVGLDKQWQNADYATDGKPGVSAAKAYSEIIAGKKQVPVIVAVIDSGTESFHPDLSANLWTNTDEIPSNGIDDDNNGYIDDMHGWSFIGGKEGDVAQDNLEFTRIYKGLKDRFDGKDASTVSATDKADYEKYLSFKKQYDERLAKAKEEKAQFDGFYPVYMMAHNTMKQLTGKENYTKEDLLAIETKDETTNGLKQMMISLLDAGMIDQIPDWKKHVEETIKYSYNLDFDPRSVVGDDYSNPRERNYGNNHIDGPEADHGTHVGGIIGATHNNIGMDGICKTAQLMIIRCVPAGDERDKDVANAIRYAVDNGAKVINMSFGKSYSPNKDVVDEAVKYAESKGVLLIHAAGNDNKNLDKSDNFPTKEYLDGGECSTWIEVGASGPELSTLAADFSNYGQKSVDIFSPGVDIYSTVPGSKYKENSGTSMASPVLAGVAATIWSLYPDLTAQQVKTILIESGTNYGKQKVKIPGETKKKTKFKKLSKSGKVVNLYSALKMAESFRP
jgi:subtilisin family serine protease